jgi:hypothetical protein
MRCQSNNLIVMLFAAILAASIAIVLLGKRTAVEADLITIPVLIDVYDGDDPEHPLIDSDIPLELYVKRVLPNEWVPGWDDDSLMAGAVAVRTWVLSPENWRGAPYAVYDGDGGQQYISGSETDPTNAAVDATAGIYMTHGFKVVNAQYRTEVGDPTNPCPAGVGDCPPPGENCPGLMYPWFSPDDYPYLLSIVDPVSAGYTRTQDDCNSVGLSQWGSQRWASQHDWSWQQILYHYYTNVQFQQLYPLTGEYYNNPDFSGSPVATTTDWPVDFDWGDGPPTRYGEPVPDMPADNFTVRWTGQITVPETNWYTFYATADDGVRLYVDNHLIIDSWTAYTETTRSGAIKLVQGSHSLRLDYHETTGDATVKLSWLAGQGLVGAYYNDYDEAGVGGVGGGISGDLVMTRPDVPLHPHWPVIGADPPRLPDDVEMSPKISADPARPMVPGNHFSVRWEGSVWADQPGVYTFTIRTDDGLRLWVDEQLITDDWNDGEREHESKVLLSSGWHEVRLEYYEQIWNAYAELAWAWSGMPEEIYLPIVVKNYQ